MLVAIAKSTGQKFIARDAVRGWTAFLCPGCNDEVYLKKGNVKIHHFAHVARAEKCTYGAGESEEHYRTKTDIYDALLKAGDHITDVEIEKDFIISVADVYCVIDGSPVAIEIQKSNLTVNKIVERTKNYYFLGISVIWILLEREHEPMDPVSGSPIYSALLFERWLHSAYFGRCYFYKQGDTVTPVNFSGSFSDSSRKIIKYGEPVRLSDGFCVHERSEKIVGENYIPKFKLFIDKETKKLINWTVENNKKIEHEKKLEEERRFLEEMRLEEKRLERERILEGQRKLEKEIQEDRLRVEQEWQDEPRRLEKERQEHLKRLERERLEEQQRLERERREKEWAEARAAAEAKEKALRIEQERIEQARKLEEQKRLDEIRMLEEKRLEEERIKKQDDWKNIKNHATGLAEFMTELSKAFGKVNLVSYQINGIAGDDLNTDTTQYPVVICANCANFQPIYHHGRGPGHCGAGVMPSGIVHWHNSQKSCGDFAVKPCPPAAG